MSDQIYAVIAVTALACGGLAASNALHDRGAPRWVTRRIAPVVGGLAYLVCVLWLQVWTAVLVVGIITVFILVLRLGFRGGLRGVRGNLPTQDWAEVTYPAAGTLSLVVGWGILGDRWLAFLPIAFMAWGDSMAGLARETVWRHEFRSFWPQASMLAVCLCAAALYQPYWAGAAGAVIGTAGERFRLIKLRFWDDNLNVVAASLAILVALSLFQAGHGS